MQDISFPQRDSENKEPVPNPSSGGEGEFSVFFDTPPESSAAPTTPVTPIIPVAPAVPMPSVDSPAFTPSSESNFGSTHGIGEPIFTSPGENGSRKKKVLLYTLLGIGIFLLVAGAIAGGIWAYTQHDKVYGVVGVENIFPKEADLVVRVSIRSDAPQAQLLQAMAKKFPGYEYLRKELDKSGEGKDADQSFLDEWKDFGVSFDDDVLPVLGNSAWVVVPDLHPVEQVVGKELGMAAPTTESFLALAQGTSQNVPGSSFVLGEQTQVRPIQGTGGLKHVDVPALDFMVGVPVTDVKKALSVVEKMQKGNDRYQVTKHAYKGYDYLELFDTKYEANAKGSEDTLRLNEARTFHALLGSNWISVSRDDWMREMIDRRNALLRFSFSKGAPSESLDRNENVKHVMNSLQADADNLVSAYYKWNIKNSCSEGEFCSYGVKDQGMQEGGFSVRLNEDGMLIRFAQLQGGKEFHEQKNGYKDGIASQIPKNSDGRWADVVFEVSDLKGMYYDFKRNYLTEKGLAEWNSDLEESFKASGVHVERDIIDNTTGSAGVVMLTSKSAFPEVFSIAHFGNGKGEALLRSFFENVVKQENAFSAQNQEMCKNPAYRAYCQGLPKREPSVVEETKTDFGTIMHEKKGAGGTSALLGSLDICGGVGKDGTTIFGTSCSGIEAILGGSGASDATQKTLASNDEYRFAEKYVGSEGFGRLHIVPLGLLYAFVGAYDSFAESSKTACVDKTGCESMSVYEQQRQDEMATTMEGLEGIFKTIPSITMQSDSIESSSMFFHIKELPRDEKERADASIAKMMSGVKNAQEKAKSASFRALSSDLVSSMAVCCSNPGTTLETRTGKNICGHTSQLLPSASEFSADSVEYQVRKNCDANGDFEYAIRATGSGVCSGETVLTLKGATFPEGCR